VVAGCVAASGNVARAAALLAGLPVTTSGSTVNRACSSGLNAIANAARYVMDDGADIVVGCGVDSITYQGGGGGGREPKLAEMYPDFWMPMIDTADVVAARYKLSREYQDQYSLESQRRMASAQQAGKFKDEIISVKTQMKKVDKETKAEILRRLHGRSRRMQPPRHDARRACEARAREGARQVRHGRQCKPAFGRRGRCRHHGSQDGRASRASAAWRVQGLGDCGMRAG
jgi:hypothetical protein